MSKGASPARIIHQGVGWVEQAEWLVRLGPLACSRRNVSLSYTIDWLAMTHHGLATSTAPYMQ
jgi:hypothetical protein